MERKLEMNIFNYLTPKSETFYLEHNCTIRQALEKFDNHKFTIVPLLDKQGKYVTTLSCGDLLRYIKNDLNFDVSKAENTTVDRIEKYRPYKYLTISANISEVYLLSLEQNYVPIVDDRMIYIGIIKRKDVIKYIFSKYDVLED